MSTNNRTGAITDRLDEAYRSLKIRLDGPRWLTRQALRFVAASATGAFVFMFTLSGTLGIPKEASYNAQTGILLPTDPAAMMVPIYLFAIVVGMLVVARVTLRTTGASHNWGVPATVALASGAAALQNTGSFPSSTQLEATVGIFAFFSVMLLAPVAVSAWVLNQTAGDGNDR